jgi:hypothetical protein
MPSEFGSPSTQLRPDLPRYFLLVGFLAVVEVCLLMLAGWLWAAWLCSTPRRAYWLASWA